MIWQECGDCVVLPTLIVIEPGGAWIKGYTQLLSRTIRLRFRGHELKVQRWRYVVWGVCARTNLLIYLILLFLCMLQYLVVSLLILGSPNSFRTKFNCGCWLIFLVICGKARFLRVVLTGCRAFIAGRVLKRGPSWVTLKEIIGVSLAKGSEMNTTRSGKFNNLLHHVIWMLAHSSIWIVARSRCLKSSGIYSRHYTCSLRLRYKATWWLIHGRTEVALGFPLPSPRCLYHLVIKR